MKLPKIKLNRYGQLVLFVCSGLVLVFLSRWKLFLTKGIIGHNWDWMTLFLRQQNFQTLFNFSFVWNDSSFGYFTALRIFQFPLFLLGSLFGGDIGSKFFVFFVLFLSFINIFIFLKFIGKKISGVFNKYAIFFGAIIYTFFPCVFNNLVGGQTNALVCYAFFPLFFYYFFNFFEKDRYLKYLFGLGLIFFLFCSSQILFLAIGVSTLFFLMLYRHKLIKYFLFIIVLVLVGTPVFFYLFSNAKRVNEILPDQLKNTLAIRQNVTSHLQTIDKVFTGAGYGDRNLFLNSLGNYRNAYLVIFYSLLIFVFGSLLIKSGLLKRKSLFLAVMLVYLGGLFLVTAGRSPFGELFILLVTKITVFRIFRSFFIFFVLVPFSFSILATVALNRVNKRFKPAKIFALSIFLISLFPVFIYGDNGKRILKGLGKDSLDIYKVNPDYLEIIKKQLRDPLWHRVMYLPNTVSPVYRKNEYQNFGQGAEPEMFFSPKPIINDFSLSGSRRQIYDIMEKNIIDDSQINQKFLAFFSFETIIRRRDVSPSFSKLAGRYNQEEITKKLDRLEPILKSEYIDYYRLDDRYFLPHFYIPQKSVYWKGEIVDLVEILDLKDYELRSEILLDTGDKNNNLSPQVNNGEKEIFIKSFPFDLIKDEELGTYKSSKKLESLEAKISPNSFAYPLVLKKEEIDLKSKKTVLARFDYSLLLADKRISEFLVFGSGKPESFGVFLYGYIKAMDSAVGILEEMEVKKDKDFLESLARFKESLAGGERRLKKYSFGGGVEEELEKVFRNYNLKIKALKPEHDFTKSVYQFNLPKEGEYEIYIKEINGLTDLEINGLNINELTDNEEVNIGGTEPDTTDIGNSILPARIQLLPQATAGGDIGGNWQLLETKYFNQGENEYQIENSDFGENLVTDSLKINNFTGDTVYRVSLRYRSDNDKSLLTVNQSQEGKLFDYYLPKTGRNFEDFDMFFRSSEDADRAFINLSVPEYENLKIENIRQQEILLRRKTDIGNSILDISGRGTETPKITFAKVNPTKYRILIEGAKEPYSIVFSESFHKGWKLYINGLTDSKINELKYGETVASYFDGEIKEGTHRMNFLEKDTFETWGKKPLPEERHYLVNGYANAWRILPADAGGQENYELIVEFEPQRLYYIGLFISFTTLGVCFVIMIISVIKKHDVKVKEYLQGD